MLEAVAGPRNSLSSKALTNLGFKKGQSSGLSSRRPIWLDAYFQEPSGQGGCKAILFALLCSEYRVDSRLLEECEVRGSENQAKACKASGANPAWV